jgi:hypothetical protein
VAQQSLDMCTRCASFARRVGSLPGRARVFRNAPAKALTTGQHRISPSFTAVLSIESVLPLVSSDKLVAGGREPVTVRHPTLSTPADCAVVLASAQVIILTGGYTSGHRVIVTRNEPRGRTLPPKFNSFLCLHHIPYQ